MAANRLSLFVSASKASAIKLYFGPYFAGLDVVLTLCTYVISDTGEIPVVKIRV